MRKIYSALLGSLALMALIVVPVSAAEGDPGTVMIMTHNCNATPVADEAEFGAVEDKAEGNPVGALVQTVLACPTTINDGDEPTDGIANDPSTFEFTVTDAEGTTYTTADAEFMAAKLCESDVELDADGDGEISEDVCLDISHYILSDVAQGELTVEETTVPEGFEQGTLRFTPTEVDGNMDAQALQGEFGDVPISLDTAADDDGSVMLHVYNFTAAAAGGEGEGEGMPNTDTIGSEQGPANGLALVAGLVAGLGAAALVLRRRVA